MSPKHPHTPTPRLPNTLSRLLLFTFFLILLLAACAPQPNDAAPPPLKSTATLVPIVSSSPTPVPTEEVTPSIPDAILTGSVTVGPLGPGPIRIDAPTQEVPAEVYTTRGIQILSEDGEQVVQEVKFEADGTYQVAVPPGTYQIDLIPNGIDRAEGLPIVLTLNPGETTTLDIVIDTGMR